MISTIMKILERFVSVKKVLCIVDSELDHMTQTVDSLMSRYNEFLIILIDSESKSLWT